MPTRTIRSLLALICAGGLLLALAAGAGAKTLAKKSVVGGTPASLSSWGFAASVLTPHTLCTGSVISPTKVLTAAHCVANPATMTVRTNSTSSFVGGDTHGVSSAAINPSWARGFIADLAVLTLKTPTTAPPVRLVTPAEDPSLTQPGTFVSVAGFGARNPSPRKGENPRIGVLTQATVNFKAFCPLPVSLMCDSGGKSGLVAFRKVKRKVHRRPIQRTVCSGDSGGPMIAQSASGPVLVGVAEATSSPPKHSAFGFVWCGLKGYPAIHTRVASWLSFIQGS
jgi:secreted trypsin-like serine protease